MESTITLPWLINANPNSGALKFQSRTSFPERIFPLFWRERGKGYAQLYLSLKVMTPAVLSTRYLIFRGNWTHRQPPGWSLAQWPYQPCSTRGHKCTCRQGYYAIINIYRVKGIAVKGNGTFVTLNRAWMGKPPIDENISSYIPLLIFLIRSFVIHVAFYELSDNFCLRIINIIGTSMLSILQMCCC